jgi:PAS domain S-box-containing protein
MVDVVNEIQDLDSFNLFRRLSEDVSDLIAILNDNFKFEYINSKAHKKLTGYTEEDLIGKTAPDLIHPKDHKKTLKSLKKVFINGEIEGETRLSCKDGSYLWVTMKAVRFFNKKGEGKILLIASEIPKPKKVINSKSEDRFKEMIDNLTEIRFWKFLQPKQAIAAYQESQEMLKIVMDSIPQYIAWKDKKLVYLGCNTNFVKLMDLENEKDIIGKTDFDLEWGEEFAYTSRVSDTRVIDNDIAEYHVIESWKVDNKQIWFDINRIALHDLEGKVVGILVTYDNITDHKKADEALKASEKKYRDLTEMLPETIYEADLDYNVTYVNSSGLAKFGYTIEDLKKGINIFDGFAPEEVKEVKGNLKDLFKRKIAEPHEYLMKKKNGTQFYGRIISTPIYKDGKPIGFRGIIHDVTESKLAEQKIKESEAKYRHLFNSTPYAVWLVNLKGYIIDCNITMNNFLTIYTKEDLIGKNFRDVIKLFLMEGDPKFEDLEPIFLERFRRLINGDKLRPFEFQINRGDGKNLWISLESSFVNVGDETLIQVFIKNITEKKEIDLKIQESEEKYRLISENINDLVFILDTNGRFLYCNESFEKIMGYKPKELIGKTPVDFAHPEDKDNIINDFKNGIKGHSGINVSRFKCKNGEYKWFESIGNISYDENGNPIRMFTVSRDITERKIIEEKLRNSEEELKRLNKELEQKVKERTKELERKNVELQKIDHVKDEFITHAAHELKTPLISISGYTDYILYKYKNLDPEIKDDLLIVQRNIERLGKLMNQLLDVMKIESHKMELNKEEVNVSKIIKNCVNELSYLIKEKNHETILNFSDGIKLLVDPDRFFQVISNLLSNAIKFTPDNGKIEIVVKRDETLNQYIFKVKDNGIGLTEVELKKLFKKFEMVKQIKDESYIKGTGLGLYISKGFIEVHGGKIWATSEGPNKGTTIYFSLPD